MRADRSALGIIPTAAFQYCEALTSASAFGWYVFPPMTFYLQWDGTDVIWSHDESDTWFPLTMEHFPDFAEHFDRAAPDDIKGFAPPFLSRSFFPGVVQIWSALREDRAELDSAVRPPSTCAQPDLRVLRRHPRDGSLVRSALHQHQAHGDGSSDRNQSQEAADAGATCRCEPIPKWPAPSHTVDSAALLSPEDWDGYRRIVGSNRNITETSARTPRRCASGRHGTSEEGAVDNPGDDCRGGRQKS
jgi:hypothetical protein